MDRNNRPGSQVPGQQGRLVRVHVAADAVNARHDGVESLGSEQAQAHVILSVAGVVEFQACDG